MKEPKALAPKEVPGIIDNLQSFPYKGAMIYIRRIRGVYNDKAVLYEYLTIFKGLLYTSNHIITFKRGQKQLTENETKHAVTFTLTLACTTIDTLLEAETEEAKHNLQEN